MVKLATLWWLLSAAGCCVTFDGSRFACDDGGTTPGNCPLGYDCQAGFCVSSGSNVCVPNGMPCNPGDTCCSLPEAMCTPADGGATLCCITTFGACTNPSDCCSGSCKGSTCD